MFTKEPFGLFLDSDDDSSDSSSSGDESFIDDDALIKDMLVNENISSNSSASLVSLNLFTQDLTSRIEETRQDKIDARLEDVQKRVLARLCVVEVSSLEFNQKGNVAGGSVCTSSCL